MARQTVARQLVRINQDYLGPAAERFVNRQIATHLNKPPERVTRRDLLKLIDWLVLSFTLLTSDTRLVEEYASRLKLVAEGSSTRGDK